MAGYVATDFESIEAELVPLDEFTPQDGVDITKTPEQKAAELEHLEGESVNPMGTAKLLHEAQEAND